MLKKFENSPTEITAVERSMSLQTPLGSVMEFARCHHNWLRHHDNVPVHTSLKITQFVTNSNMGIVLHPSYSLDLAP
jgi:hypothetical protein